ncbi:MAG: glycogen debranching N-terminal domain-containing protein, partial [Gemmatimonadaceae bacterium]
MCPSFIRSNERHAWHGQSLLITNQRGDCDDENSLTGFYFRETRYLRTLRFEIDGEQPWLCESASAEPDSLLFNYVHPELTEFGGGGSGQSQDEVSRDAHGLPHRCLDLVLTYATGVASLDATVRVANRSRETVSIDVKWAVDTDFADIQEALGGRRQQEARVDTHLAQAQLQFFYRHPDLPYRSMLRAGGDARWETRESAFLARLTLAPQQAATLTLHVQPVDYDQMPDEETARAIEAHWREWREGFARVRIPRNTLAEDIVRSNLRDLSAY